jgi:hypothetical protein
MTVVGLWLAGWLVGAEAVVVGESEQSCGSALCTRGKLPAQIASRSAGGSSQHRTGGPCHGPLVIIAKDTHLTAMRMMYSFFFNLSLRAPTTGHSRTLMRLTLSIGQPSSLLFSFSLSLRCWQQHQTDQGMCYNDWH